MWPSSHRAVKLSRNDFPGVIQMVKEQVEEHPYQPTPLPKNRVIIKTVDGTWVMHRIIARVSSSPPEELKKYRGYFLVKDLLTGLDKVTPLESGFAWEAIHNIMDVNKLKSIKDRLQNPANQFNNYPTAEMTSPSVEELEMLYNIDTSPETSVKNIDDEISSLFLKIEILNVKRNIRRSNRI